MSVAIDGNTMRYDLYGIYGSHENETGHSDESKSIMRILRDAKNHRYEPISRKYKKLFLEEKIDELMELYEEGWDGYAASPLDGSLFIDLINFIESLPGDIPLPEIVPEPTGEIAFEWYKDKWHVFVTSISSNNNLNFAGLFGSRSKINGTEYFGDKIPQVIIESIKRLQLETN